MLLVIVLLGNSDVIEVLLRPNILVNLLLLQGKCEKDRDVCKRRFDVDSCSKLL